MPAQPDSAFMGAVMARKKAGTKKKSLKSPMGTKSVRPGRKQAIEQLMKGK